MLVDRVSRAFFVFLCNTDTMAGRNIKKWILTFSQSGLSIFIPSWGVCHQNYIFGTKHNLYSLYRCWILIVHPNGWISLLLCCNLKICYFSWLFLWFLKPSVYYALQQLYTGAIAVTPPIPAPSMTLVRPHFVTSLSLSTL